jgi:hypothetical protein
MFFSFESRSNIYRMGTFFFESLETPVDYNVARYVNYDLNGPPTSIFSTDSTTLPSRWISMDINSDNSKLIISGTGGSQVHLHVIDLNFGKKKNLINKTKKIIILKKLKLFLVYFLINKKKKLLKFYFSNLLQFI